MTATVWTVFNELDWKLCDAVIVADGVEFNAHKMVLSSCSEYFRTLFTTVWAPPESGIYSITGVSADIMHLLMEYAYTRSINVTMENVKELLVAADYLSMLDLVRVCCDFLYNQLCPGNCVGIWRFANLYPWPTLKRKAYLCMLQHFEEMVRVSEEFLELTKSQLSAVIEEDELNVKQESVVLEAIIRWFNHHAQQRRELLKPAYINPV